MNLENLSPRLLVLGRNGASKTTLIDAIRFCVCGQVYDAEGKRIILEDLVGRDGGSAEIKIAFTHGGGTYEMFATINKRSAEFKFQGKRNDDARAALWALLEAEPALGEARLSSTAMLTGGGELARLLLERSQSGVDSKQFKMYCGGKYEDTMGYLRSAFGICDDAVTMDALQGFGESALVKRKEHNSKIKRLKDRVKDIGIPDIPINKKTGKPFDVSILEAAQQNLAALRQTERELQYQIDHYQAAKSDPEAEKRAGILSKQVAKLETEATKHEAAWKTIVAEQSAIQGRLFESEAMANAAEKTLARLRKELGGDKCPTCRRPVSDTVRKDILAEFTKEFTKHKTAEDAARTELDAKNAEIDIVSATQSAHSKALNDARQELAIAQRESYPAKPTAKTKEQLEAEFQTVVERIGKGAHIVGPLELETERQAIERELAGETERAEYWNWAVDSFQKGDYYSTLAQSDSANFVRDANSFLQPFGYGIRLIRRGKGIVPAMDVRGVTIPYAQCSKGERVVCDAAVAINAGTPGVPIVIDDVDSLDFQMRAALLAHVKATEPDATVILAAAFAASPEPDIEAIQKAMGDVQVVWCDK